MNDSDSVELFIQSWAKAEQDNDAGTLERLLSDDYVAVGPFGFLLNRSEWIERLTSKKLQYEKVTVDDVTIRFFDNIAVVIAKQTQKGTYEGNPIPDALRITLILHKIQDNWQMVGQHISLGRPPMPVGK